MLVIFRAHSRLELLKVAKAIFAVYYILLKWPIDCRATLAIVIVLKSWKDWVQKGDEQSRKMNVLVVESIASEEF